MRRNACGHVQQVLVLQLHEGLNVVQICFPRQLDLLLVNGIAVRNGDLLHSRKKHDQVKHLGLCIAAWTRRLKSDELDQLHQ